MSSANGGATNRSESGFGAFRADNQKTASEGTTAEDGATEATVNTDDAVEQSAQDFGEQEQIRMEQNLNRWKGLTQNRN